MPSPAARCPHGYLRLFLTAALVLLLDQWSKSWIVAHIPYGTYQIGWGEPPYTVIEGFFYIVHIGNKGAAWGILQGYSFWLGLLGIAAIIGMFFLRHQLQLERPLLQYAFGLLAGGIIGNVIDRFRYDHVVDFLDFHFGSYRYPSFNVADSGITLGVSLYIIISLIDWWRESHQKKISPHNS